MHKRVLGAMVGATLALAGAAQAAKVPIYDDFSGQGIDRTKWFDTEQGRFIDGKQLRLGRYIYGGTSSDAGVVQDTYGENLLNTTVPSALSADILVDDITWLEGCLANAIPARASARLIASFFNGRPGGPVPGDRTGDVLAQVRLTRTSNTSLPVGQMQAQGVLSRCSQADCNAADTIGVVDFGSVALNTVVNGRVDWIRKTKTFRFTVGGVVKDVAYTDSHGNAPVASFTQVSVRTEAPNCLSGPKTKAGLAAFFDNVRVGY